MLERKREGMEVSIGHANSKIANAKVLLQKHDLSALQEGTEMVGIIDKLLQEGSTTYLKASVDSYLPFSVDEGFNEAIDKLGVIGGGATPSNVQCVTITGLLHLQWHLENQYTPVTEYELEYEAVNYNSGVQCITLNPDQCMTRVDMLCPGYSYCFRLRSRNMAGFGVWSHPVIGKMPNFPLEISCSGEFVKIQIPCEGNYRITVRGAKAADGQMHTGGRGAIISATFFLDANTVLEMSCGGMSTMVGPSTGGAGGSFIVIVHNSGRRELLIAAGGGGGTRGFDAQDRNGNDASTEEFGSGGAGADSGAGGVDGNAGKDAIANNGVCVGYGGAGYMESSSTASCYMHWGKGGNDGGGFGGGGSAGKFGGGGGGGYSGGGGGLGGGGGGSYVQADGMDVVKSVGHMSDGSILIEAMGVISRGIDSLSSTATDHESM